MSIRQAGEPITDAELAVARQAQIQCVFGEENAWRNNITSPLERIQCRLYPKLAFFFDGTGNNLQQEMAKPAPQRALSNVARLFLAAIDEPEVTGKEAFAYYFPGVGTPFRYQTPQVGPGPALARDDKGGAIGLGFGAGGEMRLAAALNDLRYILEHEYSSGALRHMPRVSLAVFGFSRGATLARAFVRRLIAEQCEVAEEGGLLWKGTYGERVKLHITFMGLFDTVASVGGPGLHLGWASKLAIPPQVESCVHMVAAHEVRRAFPLDSVRVGRDYPANCEEIVYPGVHSDVGGGYHPGFQGRSNLLARLPLRDMYARALRAGVMLHGLDTLPIETRDEFILPEDSTCVTAFRAYRAALPDGGDTLEAMLAPHRSLQFRWRGMISRSQTDTQVLGALHRVVDPALCAAVTGNDNPHRSCQPRGWKYELPAQPDIQARQLLAEQRGLARRLPRIREPYELEEGQRLDRPRNDYEDLIVKAWDNFQPLPEEVSFFLAEHVHDSVAHFTDWPCALYEQRGIYCDEDYYLARGDRHYPAPV